jgi:aspartyl-tRNA(Asn)/glutamyl-tRNA(Gln) amidotransferase subunit A
MSDSEFTDMSASSLIEGYRRKEFSPVEVTEAMLAAIEAWNPVINAFHHVDGEAALDQARASEARWRTGASQGLLDGVPTAVKDGLPMTGVPIYRGSLANGSNDIPATADAPCVTRLRENGAVILGKTTMCDYGMLASGYSSKFGPTRNPRNPSVTSGGSSSGSAAAVAAGIAPVIIGTDIVGSVRNPASFCGLFGHKPSFGRVPYYPQTSPSVCAGPIARNVHDAALLLNVLAQPDSRDITALDPDGQDYTQGLDDGVAGQRFGLVTELGLGPRVDSEVAALVEKAAWVFELLSAGVTPVTKPFEPHDITCADRFYQVRALAELTALPEDVQRSAEVIWNWSESARSYSATEHYQDYLGTQDLRQRFMDMMDGLDFLLLPTVPVPPYAAENPGLDNGDIFAPWSNTFVVNLTQQPAATIPCGETASGLPVGLQIVGRRFDDIGVLRAARAFEIASGLTINAARL